MKWWGYYLPIYKVPNHSFNSSFIVDDHDEKEWLKNTEKEKVKNSGEQGENGKVQWQSLTSRSNQQMFRIALLRGFAAPQTYLKLGR